MPVPRPSAPLPQPLTPGVDHDGEVFMLTVTDPETGARAAFFAPPLGSRRPRVSVAQGQLLGQLQRAQFEALQLDERIGAMVRHGRSLGIAWPLLAFSTGLSESGARKRFGDGGDVLAGEILDGAPLS